MSRLHHRIGSTVTAAILAVTMAHVPLEAAQRHVPERLQAAGAPAAAHVGYVFLWYSDPDCPNSPDSHEIRAVYGYDGPDGIVITSDSHYGYTTYNCTGGPRGGNVPNDAPWLWHDGWSSPVWGWTNYFPPNWEAGDCWGGGQPC